MIHCVILQLYVRATIRLPAEPLRASRLKKAQAVGQKLIKKALKKQQYLHQLLLLVLMCQFSRGCPYEHTTYQSIYRYICTIELDCYLTRLYFMLCKPEWKKENRKKRPMYNSDQLLLKQNEFNNVTISNAVADFFHIFVIALLVKCEKNRRLRLKR